MVITGWANVHIVCRMREVTDLQGSQQLKTSDGGGWDTVCLHRGKYLETGFSGKWIRGWDVYLGRVDSGVLHASRNSPGKGLCI